MRIAVATMTPEVDAPVAKHAARAPYYLLFDKQGEFLKAVPNPFSEVDRGAAPKAARLLAGMGASVLAAGDFGPRFVSELEERGIGIVRRTGQVSDIVSQLIA